MLVYSFIFSVNYQRVEKKEKEGENKEAFRWPQTSCSLAGRHLCCRE